jgi:Fe(3+) dicitrate transport protein
VSATYTYTGSHFRSSFTSDSPQLTDVERGDQLPYVPRHVLSVALGAGGQYWGVFPSLSYLSDMRDVAGQGPIPAAERIPQYYVIDVATQGHPTKRSTIYLNFQNLTNNVYMVSRRPFGTRPGLPFQLMAGFKYHFA